MRGRGALAAAFAVALLAVPASAGAAPPPGAAISDNLEYVARVAGANGITEGKFDEVRGDDILVVTGRFGFKTYDVSDPEDPQLMDEFLPDGLADFGYWQNEDMELDTRRKLIIGALDDPHNEYPACHVHQQDWGVPVRVTTGGATRLPLVLAGLDAKQG